MSARLARFREKMSSPIAPKAPASPYRVQTDLTDRASNQKKTERRPDQQWHRLATAPVDMAQSDTCLQCSSRIGWPQPDGVVFADGNAIHPGCYEQAEVDRLLETGRRSVESPDALTDPAEVMLAGEPLP